MMRAVRRCPASGLRRRGGFSVGAVLGSLIVLAVLTTAGYVLLAPVLFGHAIPGSGLLTTVGSVDDQAMGEAAVVDDDSESAAALEEGAVEITGFTGEDDSLSSLLGSNIADEEFSGHVARDLAAVVKQGIKKTFDPSTPLEPDTRYSITIDRKGNFLKASVELDPSNVFHAVNENGKIRSWKEDVVLDFKLETVTIKMENTLVDSVLKSGEAMGLANELNRVFRYDIDFQSESVKGDICKVLVERRYADDRASGYGRVLCAVYDGKKTGRKTAVLFNGTYYDEKGQELKKDFLRSPLKTLRVTSRFGKRFHPIFKRWRHHDGVDYAAPRGESVWCISTGTVRFAGWQNGYGKYVCVRHDNGTESRYGHLDRIFVQKGQRVKQNLRIGTVGMTGDTTGPHLHFEFRNAKSELKDPLKVKMVASVRSVQTPLRGRFQEVAQERFRMLQTQMAAAAMGRPVPAGVR